MNPDVTRLSRIRRGERNGLTLTRAEASDLLYLLERNRDSGEHFAPAAQYWARNKRLTAALRDACDLPKEPA